MVIMPHEGIVDHCSIQHPIAQHVIKAANKIKLRDPAFLNSPASVLIRWSSTIRKSWLKDNEAA